MYTYYIIKECLHKEEIVGTEIGLEAAELRKEKLQDEEKNVWASYYLKMKRE